MEGGSTSLLRPVLLMLSLGGCLSTFRMLLKKGANSDSAARINDLWLVQGCLLFDYSIYFNSDYFICIVFDF